MNKKIQLIKSMGLRYTLYRGIHELEKRLGFLRKRHPKNPHFRQLIELEHWKSFSSLFVISERDSLGVSKIQDEKLANDAKRILNGELRFFYSEWKFLGKNYDWITNPDSGFRYDISLHWSQISDLNLKNGDIKYVWEKSRFSYLLTIMRYDYHFDEDHSDFVFSEIESWIDANPINQGPNWRCSQEISLRIFNWCFALNFYKDSGALDDSRWDKIQHVIFWSLHHVYHHIDFSRIAVRNNHAITETLLLALSELLFPFIPETKKWSKDGRKWFEEEIAYQIYEDGTFLQFSMNYHRVVIQLLSLAVSLTEKHGKPFKEVVYDRAYKSLNFLFQCLQKENGRLPNQGSNDGALFFPLSNADFRDYRPQLNTLHFLLTGDDLFDDENAIEDRWWMSEKRANTFQYAVLQTRDCSSFPFGGYYTFRHDNTFTFIRCGAFKDRPNQCDNLHIDIWVDGENVLWDTGSYKYNTDPETIMYFRGCEGHNTLSVAGQNQMLKGGRFLWYYWVREAVASLKESSKAITFEGKIEAFRHIKEGIYHLRNVRKERDRNVWLVEDEVHGVEEEELVVYWHINPQWFDRVKIICRDYSGNQMNPMVEQKWYSGYYGIRERSIRMSFRAKTQGFKTEISVI